MPKEIIKKHSTQILGKANVVAVGVGFKVTGGKRTSTLSIICSVSKKIEADKVEAKDLIPGILDGMPTDVVETGVIKALQSPTEKHRPAPGGVSIGHLDITAGTLGCLVKKGGQHDIILSNNHVLADSNNAEVGDAILQPGPHDGGRYPADHIADLEQFIPIDFGEDIPSDCPIAMGVANILNRISRLFGRNARLQSVGKQATANLVDAAIATPLNSEDVKDEILEIGPVQGIAEAELGMDIKKSGRTTGLMTGEILQMNVTLNVSYGDGLVAQFTDQFMSGVIGQGGDSGSAVLDKNDNLVGLLFAGSDTATVMNRIQNVFSALDISL